MVFSLECFKTYIYLVCLISVIFATSSSEHIQCNVATHWYCDKVDPIQGSAELLKFGYRNEANDVDLVGKVLLSEQSDDHTFDEFKTRGSCSNPDSEISLNVIELLGVGGEESETECFDLYLEGNRPSTPKLCFSTENAFWYGGAELHGQRWPLNDVRMSDQPYISNDFVSFTNKYGNVLERFWVNSRGIAIYMPEYIPLFSEINEDSICFSARYSKHFKPVSGTAPKLHMLVCDTKDVKEAFELVSTDFIDFPQGIPDERMFKSPIWSTWAKYKTNINEETILEYADEIIDHGFSNSQLEIDDMYTSTYGDFDFDSNKFGNATRMIENLKSKGFRVTAWVTPFANPNSEAFQIGMKNSYWLQSLEDTPALIKWWQGIGGVLDVTNKAAVDWYIDRLTQMKTTYGIDSFKFDAGETSYVPSHCKPREPWLDTTQYATKYVEAVSRMGPMIEVRCGYRSQRHPVFVRMADKESRWGYENGLKTLIPTVLTLGIIGYPYVLPDMIGGNGYNYEDDVDNPFISTKIPERELYIRWLEVSAFFPAMQFSFVPWQYDQEVVKIARKYVEIHENTVTPIVLKAAEESVAKGTPIIRPLWWIAPDDLNALETDSEFLVGDSLLVAPILDKGSRERDIYLPEGIWEDEQRGDTVIGGQWLRNYKVELDQVALFWLKEKL